MKHFLLVCIFVLTEISCQQGDENSSFKKGFDDEIRNRLGILTSLSAYDDSLAIQIAEIRQELSQLLLLSKDAENPGACANKSKLFFERMAEKYEIDLTDFEPINKSVNPSEMELNLKKNELFLLNQIVFKNSGAEIQLFSAQEETGQ